MPIDWKSRQKTLAAVVMVLLTALLYGWFGFRHSIAVTCFRSLRAQVDVPRFFHPDPEDNGVGGYAFVRESGLLPWGGGRIYLQAVTENSDLREGDLIAWIRAGAAMAGKQALVEKVEKVTFGEDAGVLVLGTAGGKRFLGAAFARRNFGVFAQLSSESAWFDHNRKALESYAKTLRLEAN